MTISPVSRSSAVDLCAQSLRDAVLKGEYLPGARLPPERSLAVSLGVNRVTVRGALARLVREGVLSVRQGSGYEVLNVFASAGLELVPQMARHLQRGAELEVVADMLEVRRALARVVLARFVTRRPPRRALDELAAAIEALELATGLPRAQFAEADLGVLGMVVNATGSHTLRLMLNPIGSVLLALPGLVDSMFRSPHENVLGWRALLAWLEADERQLEPILAVLEERDRATLSHLRRRS